MNLFIKIAWDGYKSNCLAVIFGSISWLLWFILYIDRGNLLNLAPVALMTVIVWFSGIFVWKCTLSDMIFMVLTDLSLETQLEWFKSKNLHLDGNTPFSYIKKGKMLSVYHAALDLREGLL